MARGRFGHGDRRLLQPCVHQIKGCVDAQRLLKEPWSRGQPEKRQEDDPRKPNGLRSRNSSFQPRLGLFVVSRMFVDLIDEKVDAADNESFAQRQFPTQFLIFQGGCDFQRLVPPEILVTAERIRLLHEVAALDCGPHAYITATAAVMCARRAPPG